MRKLPIGIQSIQKILNKKEYVYVDKTGFIKRLFDEGSPHYFISRPRRFGKSLFLDTLSEIFKGNKQLFKECQIYNSDYSWQEHPVLLFDFAQISNSSYEEFIDGLKAELKRIGQLHRIQVEGPSIQFQLKVLVEELAKKNRVVVLVDEYDSPIINNLKKPEIADQNRDVLKGFFTTLKGLDQYLKFTFVTGVSKFSQVSLFSGPNHLTDITMSPEYAGMMGYTEEEVKLCFPDHIDDVVKSRENLSAESILSEIRTWYNGYRFSERELSVYNPYSTLRYFVAKKVEGYWYSTGTPSFLVDQVKNHPRSIVPLSGITASKSQLLDISEVTQIDLAALMFQTGYLTVVDYNSVTNRYVLGFPNEEVREAFFETLIHHFAKIDTILSMECQEALDTYNLATFFKKIQSMIASFPYQLFIKASESTYHGILLGILKGMGFQVYGEDGTNLGRIDIVIEADRVTYIIELKLDSKAEAAIEQIHQKKYYEKYLHKDKEVVIVGVGLSSKARNISDWEGALFLSDGKLKRKILPN